MSADEELAKPAPPAWPVEQPAKAAASERSATSGADQNRDPDSQPDGGRILGFLTRPSVAAIIVWLIATPVAFVLPRLLPFSSGAGSQQWIAMPLAGGFLAAAVLWLVWLKWPTRWLAGATAGVMSGWFTLSLATAVRGTAFPFLGLLGDAGRLTAMATRYSVTAASSDMFIPGVPSEYPPLFPWVVGRTAALFDVPAWRLVGDFEILFMSLTMLVAFLLWQRLVSPWLALVVATASYMAFPIPSKAYEAIALAAFLPWVLLTFINPPRGRLHWLLSGIIAGFIVVSYFGWIVFGAFGMLAIAWRTWRVEERTGSDRKAFLLYLAKMGGVAFLTAAWFLVPLIWAKVTIGGNTVADLYGSSNLLEAIFPFLEITQPGLHGLLAVVHLIGLIGLIWLRGRVWWASPLLALVVGAYVYRLVGAIAFLLTGHTLLAQYTPAVYMAAMSVAAPLTIVHALPKVLRQLWITPPKLGAAIGVLVVLAFTGYSFCIDWMPGTKARYSEYT
ncbi:MAG TPA: arabinofuranosyltransferase, partial [Candidatus Limnocylindrales bacterium]|nr:arabinofuranosyltransferase [Candidatus Limnocylindrales bacterium]